MTYDEAVKRAEEIEGERDEATCVHYSEGDWIPVTYLEWRMDPKLHPFLVGWKSDNTVDEDRLWRQVVEFAVARGLRS